MRSRPAPRGSASATARTRAHGPRPPARGGSAGGGKAAVTYFLRLRSGRPGRLDRRFGPLPGQSPAGGPDAGDPGRELGPSRRDPLPPRPASPGGPPPRPSRGPPCVPQLVPVRPMNWCVLGFHTNSFHSSTTCPQLFFSFWMTILAAGGESRAGLGAAEKLGCGAQKPPPHAPERAGSKGRGGEGDPPQLGSCCKFRGARPRAAGCWQRGVGCTDPRPPSYDEKGDCQSREVRKGKGCGAASPPPNLLETK